jgi:hypothetical protein
LSSRNVVILNEVKDLLFSNIRPLHILYDLYRTLDSGH